MLRELAYWAMLQRAQWYSRDKLTKIQSRRLGKLLRHAYEKVPFYREIYGDKLSPKNVNDPFDTLKELPVVSRKTLAETPLDRRTAISVNPAKCLRRHTSGYSGEPVVILETKESAAYWKALYLRRLWAYGVRPGDRIMRALPAIPASRLNFFLGGVNPLARMQRKSLEFMDLSEGGRISFDRLITYRPKVLVAQPSYLLALVRVGEERGLNISIETIVTTGEVLTPRVRRILENAFNSEVYDTYSTVEVGNIAWECPSHDGYHINKDSVVLELAEPKPTGHSAMTGKAVVTCLYRYATPIIRYLIGDVVTVKDDECSCGRGLPLLDKIEGRVVDCLRTRDGDYISPYAILSSLHEIDGLRRFRIIQHEDYTVEVLVVCAPDMDSDRIVKSVEDSLGRLMRSLQLRVRLVDHIDTGFEAKPKLVESRIAC